MEVDTEEDKEEAMELDLEMDPQEDMEVVSGLSRLDNLANGNLLLLDKEKCQVLHVEKNCAIHLHWLGAGKQLCREDLGDLRKNRQNKTRQHIL
ncbi:hypothetical protein DUI87_16746 [Hirundo rustica rustica]|uniref:Uncharacterized protein n=1 Tax=Hirundo rustica rustica TaxID=333673 RepID=A0A3M0K2N1_HIRRU|nr:hypothetical protein DUI87_16746 [Hirundo rustica rustica]